MDIKLILKGFLIGIGKIIPGFSGALLAISFNVYDKLINSITNFFSNKKENIIFLLNLSIGIISGIILFSKIILYLLNNYYLYTTIFFTGLIIGGIIPITKTIKKDIKNIILIFISLSFIIFISIYTSNNTYIIQNNYIDILKFIYAGILEAIGTIVPGVSATALLMLSGLYDLIINSLSNINLYVLIPFSISLFISSIILLKIVEISLKKYYQQSYSIIIGISIGTIIILLLKILKYLNIYNILFCILLLYLGFTLSKRFDK